MNRLSFWLVLLWAAPQIVNGQIVPLKPFPWELTSTIDTRELSGQSISFKKELADGRIVVTKQLRGSNSPVQPRERIRTFGQSHDGGFVAAVTQDKVILWESLSNESIWQVSTDTYAYSAVAISSDGVLVALSLGSSLVLYDRDTQRKATYSADLALPPDFALAFKPHSSDLLVLGPTSATVLRYADGELTMVERAIQRWNEWDALRAEIRQAGRSSYTAAAFSPDGQRLAIASHGLQRISIGRTRTMRHLGVVELLTSTKSGNFFASEGMVLRAPNASIHKLAFSSDGKFLCAASHSAVSIWRIAGEQQDLVHEKHVAPIGDFDPERPLRTADVDVAFTTEGDRFLLKVNNSIQVLDLERQNASQHLWSDAYQELIVQGDEPRFVVSIRNGDIGVVGRARIYVLSPRRDPGPIGHKRTVEIGPPSPLPLRNSDKRPRGLPELIDPGRPLVRKYYNGILLPDELWKAAAYCDGNDAVPPTTDTLIRLLIRLLNGYEWWGDVFDGPAEAFHAPDMFVRLHFSPSSTPPPMLYNADTSVSRLLRQVFEELGRRQSDREKVAELLLKLSARAERYPGSGEDQYFPDNIDFSLIYWVSDVLAQLGSKPAESVSWLIKAHKRSVYDEVVSGACLNALAAYARTDDAAMNALLGILEVTDAESDGYTIPRFRGDYAYTRRSRARSVLQKAQLQVIDELAEMGDDAKRALPRMEAVRTVLTARTTGSPHWDPIVRERFESVLREITGQ